MDMVPKYISKYLINTVPFWNHYHQYHHSNQNHNHSHNCHCIIGSKKSGTIKNGHISSLTTNTQVRIKIVTHTMVVKTHRSIYIYINKIFKSINYFFIRSWIPIVLYSIYFIVSFFVHWLFNFSFIKLLL